MDVFLARQPVFKKDKTVFGYELLFRLGANNVFPQVDGNAATSNLMSNLFFPFDYKEILGSKYGLINFTEQLIDQKIPLLLPKESFIIEVLEDIEPTKTIIDALSLFRNKGFVIASDDFTYHDKYRPMMDLCHIIKFDVIATPIDSLTDTINDIKKHYNIKLLAEKIETHDDFLKAKEIGFDLFQGYFFSKPELLSTKSISSDQVTRLKLVNEVNKQDIELEKIEKLIKKDAAISFKLLKYINSAYFNRRLPINTIKDSLTHLGTKEIQKFISIVVLTDLKTKKPNELVRASIIRARMCENFGKMLNTKFTTDELFTIGLFSMMDALLDCNLDYVLKHIAFSNKIETALRKKDKEFNTILSMVESLEVGNWKHPFWQSIAEKDIEKKLTDYYFDSIKMGNTFF